jgi:predicted transcriptional regulator YheO
MKKFVAKEHQSILMQMKAVAEGLSKTLAPFCEVVVHDLLHPRNAIFCIENNLSGRKVGDPATELGLARIADESYPQIVANYANQFADGRQVKSTSIGIKDSHGRYVAALCLNIDVSQFKSLELILSQFGAIDGAVTINESLDPANANAIRAYIDRFAANLATTPRALKARDRKQVLRELKIASFMDIRHSADVIARHLDVSKATVYNDVRQAPLENSGNNSPSQSAGTRRKARAR